MTVLTLRIVGHVTKVQRHAHPGLFYATCACGWTSEDTRWAGVAVRWGEWHQEVSSE